MIAKRFRHPGRRLLGAVAGGLASMFVAAVLAPVAAHSPDPMLAGGLFTQNEVLGYRWGGSPPSAMRTALNAGVDDANTTRKSKAPTFAYDAGGANTVYYGVDVPCGLMRSTSSAGTPRRWRAAFIARAEPEPWSIGWIMSQPSAADP